MQNRGALILKKSRCTTATVLLVLFTVENNKTIHQKSLYFTNIFHSFFEAIYRVRQVVADLGY